jgi:ribokinase
MAGTHGARIAVVGSLMMDLVVRVPRPPAMGESLIGRDFQTFTGGKGANQAVAAARLGAEQVAIIGRIGDDDFGRRIVRTLEEEGIDCRGIIRDRRHGTGVAIPIVYDDGRNSIISVPQANLALSAGDIRAMSALIAEAEMVLIQFEVGLDAVAAALAVAAEADVPVLLNAAPVVQHASHLLTQAAHLVVKEVEAAAFAPYAGGDHLAEARYLLGDGTDTVVVTLGEDGALLAQPNRMHVISPFVVEAVDTVGAGDAFGAAYAVGLTSGMGVVEAAQFAAAAGALAVTKQGAQTALPTRTAVEGVLRGTVT